MRALAEHEGRDRDAHDGDQHRERRDAARRVPGQERRPQAGADDRGDDDRVGEPRERGERGRRVQRRERTSDRRRTLDRERQREEGQGRHDRHPRHETHRAVRPRLARRQVAEGPAEPAGDGEQDGHERRVPADQPPVDRDPRESRDGEQDAEHLAAGEPLTEQPRGQDHGERGGGLQDERAQPGGHARRHREVEEGELQHPEAHAVPEQPPQADLRSRHEQQGGHGDDGEPEGGEEERREVLERRVDRREVRTPEDGDDDGEETVARAHGARVP